jgi:AAA domain
MNRFIKATRHKVPLKLAITGPSGSVKTYSANLLATGLANGDKVALLDTENKSAALYADRFNFDVLDISPPFTEAKFIDGINVAVAEGYAVLIIDSFSHSWQGILDYKAGLDARGGNSYVNWNKAGAKFNAVLASILQSQIHIICCMRSKMDYVLEPDTRGKMIPRRVGLAPVMRDGIEYEFAVVFDGDLEHFVTVSKDRTGLFVDQRFQISEETGRTLLNWLNSAPEIEPAPAPAPLTPSTSTDRSAKPVAEPSPQQRLQKALFGLHESWVTDFLVNRQKIAPGQSVLDAPAAYCESAMRRITEFRSAIIKFGEDTDHVPV